MREKNEILFMLLRYIIMFMIVVAGVICFFIFPAQGFNMLGSSCLIAFSYWCVLNRRKGQLIESIILMGVLATTIFAYTSPDRWGGWLFLVQLCYFFYGMGKALSIFKEYKKAFQQLWFHKKG